MVRSWVVSAAKESTTGREVFHEGKKDKTIFI
jgi:hypothetical protein